VKNIVEKFVSRKHQTFDHRARHFLRIQQPGGRFQGLLIIRSFGQPVIFGCNSIVSNCQEAKETVLGTEEFAAPLMRAGVGAGVDGLFIEVHPEPGRALCDGSNMIPLAEMKGLLKQAKAIHDLVAKGEGA
jgi:2-dehydro-3-deoxyphosphooctonate aldolase (KDO 8-P synthase)